MICMLLTERTVRVCQYCTYGSGQGGRSWLEVDRRGRQSSKGVNCDILTQGLIGLIEYSYHQGIPSFLKARLQRTPGLSVLDSEQFQDG
jgi:hypothetical protein